MNILREELTWPGTADSYAAGMWFSFSFSNSLVQRILPPGSLHLGYLIVHLIDQEEHIILSSNN